MLKERIKYKQMKVSRVFYNLIDRLKSVWHITGGEWVQGMACDAVTPPAPCMSERNAICSPEIYGLLSAEMSFTHYLETSWACIMYPLFSKQESEESWQRPAALLHVITCIRHIHKNPQEYTEIFCCSLCNFSRQRKKRNMVKVSHLQSHEFQLPASLD